MRRVAAMPNARDMRTFVSQAIPNSLVAAPSYVRRARVTPLIAIHRRAKTPIMRTGASSHCRGPPGQCELKLRGHGLGFVYTARTEK